MTARKTAGHSAKHVSSSKHHVTSKHAPTAAKKPPAGTKARVTTKGTHAHHAKARGFAVGDLLPVCAFEAVAQSLRLAGQLVSDDDVAGLWEACGEREVTIREALGAFRQAGFRVQAAPDKLVINDVNNDVAVLRVGERVGGHVFRRDAAQFKALGGFVVNRSSVHALILGVDVPGPHAVLATADGWWSWGELHEPWPCRIEEAWAVSWP